MTTLLAKLKYYTSKFKAVPIEGVNNIRSFPIELDIKSVLIVLALRI